ncbi:MAG: sulfatase [Phycisphaerae bacterium]|nr:sulfatase [Phycisphaerae bacterium]
MARHDDRTRREFLEAAAGGAAALAMGSPISAALRANENDVNKKPNFLVIFVDDMGYNDLGCYNAKDPAIKTPNIDRMAAEGVKFTDWFSACSVCAPSRASLLTGRYPSRCGLPVCPSGSVFGENFQKNIGLQDSEVTIAKLLAPLGYRTAWYGKSHLGNDPKFYPLRHGFDEYYGSLNNFPIGGTCPVLEGNKVVDPKVRYHQIHQKLTDRTIKFMTESKKAGKPFFIYLAHYLVHGPWEPNRKFASDAEWKVYQNQPVKGHLRNGGEKIYPALVRELDWHVGKVLAAMKELELDDNTFVVFISDNGPWLPAGSAWPLRGSKYSTFEGGHRVPAIARWPGKIPPDQTCDKLCSTMDVFPTIAAMASAKLPKDRIIDGLNILPVMQGRAGAEAHDVMYYYNGLTLEVVRRGKWKLHLPRQPHMKVYWSRGKLGGLKQIKDPILYDLSKDIREKKNVADEHPVVVKRMLALAEKARQELGDWNRKGRDQKPLLDFQGDPNAPRRRRRAK